MRYHLLRQPSKYRTHQCSRRTLIKSGLGGLLSGSFAGLPGSILPAATRAAAQASSAPYLLFVYCSGGWDTTLVFDPKLTSSYCTAEPGATQATGAAGITYIGHANRPSVQTFFEAYGDHAIILNGLSTGSMVHKYAAAKALSAIPSGSFRAVDWLSYYANFINPICDAPHVVIDAPYIPGDYTHIATRLTTDLIAEYSGPIADEEDLGSTAEAALANFRNASYNADLVAAVADASLDKEKLQALYHGYLREGILRTRLTAATDALGPQPTTESDFARNGKLAIELFANGATQAATIQCGQDYQWDTTSDHFNQGSDNFEQLFAGLNSILTHASTRGIDERLMLIVTSELGRAPRIDSQGGKGPWPYTSALIWGSSFAGGRVLGATDDALRGLPIDPIFGEPNGLNAVTLEMGHIMASLYLKLGLAAKLILPNHPALSPLLANGTTP